MPRHGEDERFHIDGQHRPVRLTRMAGSTPAMRESVLLETKPMTRRNALALATFVVVLLAIPVLVVIFSPRSAIPTTKVYCSAPAVSDYTFPPNCIGS